MKRTVSDTQLSIAQFASGMNVLAGVWMIVAPWILRYSGAVDATINAVLVGIAIAILGLFRTTGLVERSWPSWVNVLLGYWLMISPTLFDHAAPTKPNGVLIGLMVVVFALISAALIPRATS